MSRSESVEPVEWAEWSEWSEVSKGGKASKFISSGEPVMKMLPHQSELDCISVSQLAMHKVCQEEKRLCVFAEKRILTWKAV